MKMMSRLAGAGVLLTTAVAAAADPAAADPAGAAPTVSQCLAASDASLQADNEHHLRAERDQLLVCAAASCPAEVRTECQRRGDDVNRRLPTLIFAARDETGADLGTVHITVDQEDLGQQRAGAPIAVDPGLHDLVFESAGRPKVKMKLVIVEGQKDRAELVVFAAASAVPAPSPAPESGHPGRTQRWLGLGLGAAGVVGLGLGTAFGILAVSKQSSANDVCPNTLCRTQAGVDDWTSASHAGTVSTVSFIAGGVLLASGAALWLTAPRGSDAGAGFGVGAGQLRLDARF